MIVQAQSKKSFTFLGNDCCFRHMKTASFALNLVITRHTGCSYTVKRLPTEKLYRRSLLEERLEISNIVRLSAISEGKL